MVVEVVVEEVVGEVVGSDVVGLWNREQGSERPLWRVKHVDSRLD